MNQGPFDSDDPARRLAPVPTEGDPAYYGTSMNVPGGQARLTDAEARALAADAAQPDHDDDAEGGHDNGEENTPRAAGPPGGGDETNIPRDPRD